MTKAFIQNGVVIEVARVDPFTIFNPAYAAQFVNAPDEVEPGWLYDGEGFTAPPVQPPASVIPAVVTMRQARLALLSADLLDDVEAAVAAAGRAAQIEWEYATEVERTHPLIAQVQQAQGMTDEQIDQLFIAAAAL